MEPNPHTFATGSVAELLLDYEKNSVSPWTPLFPNDSFQYYQYHIISLWKLSIQCKVFGSGFYCYSHNIWKNGYCERRLSWIWHSEFYISYWDKDFLKTLCLSNHLQKSGNQKSVWELIILCACTETVRYS